MPGIANYQIPPPAKWEDFEDLCLDLWHKIWRDDRAQKNGRRGQPQHGVDIFGRPGGGVKWAGVQCKGKNEALGTALTKKELLAEVEKAKGFLPPQDPEQEEARISLGAKSFALRDARTIFFLLPESIDVSAGVSPEPTKDQNFIFELIWPHSTASKERPAGSGHELAGFWWVRVGTTIWIQQFWREASAAADEPFEIAALKGLLFVFDSDTNSWQPAEHPEACDCGRPEVHDKIRQLASALMAAYSSVALKQHVVIAKRVYPVVSLMPPTPGSLS